VDETFDAGFELNEGTVRDEAGDLAAHLEVDRVFFGNLVPGIFRHLFHAEGNPQALLVDFEDEDFDFLTGLQQVGRVGEPAPRHVGHVEQAVETVKVHEGTEFRKIFDAALHLRTLVEVGKELGALLVALLLNQFASGEDNVLAVFVEFDDAALEGLAHEFAEVFRGIDVDLGGGQEGFHPDVDSQTPLDDTFDHALDGFAGFAEFDDFVPILLLSRFLAGKDHEAVLVFQAFEEDFNLLADGQIVRGAEFAQIDGAFGFVADVDHDFARATFDDAAFDDGSLTEILHRL